MVTGGLSESVFSMAPPSLALNKRKPFPSLLHLTLGQLWQNKNPKTFLSLTTRLLKMCYGCHRKTGFSSRKGPSDHLFFFQNSLGYVIYKSKALGIHTEE